MSNVHEYAAKLRTGRMLFGYFDSDAAARSALAQLPDDYVGVWRGLNPLRSDSPLLSALNAPLHASKHRAGSGDIDQRATLLLDFDAACSSDEMSNDQEHGAAISQAEQCSAWLVSLDWPRPIRIDSGRGCQLHVAVNLPADSSTDKLARDLLRALKSRYPLIDAGMHDRPRLARLPGFWNRKTGQSTSERPWRMAKVLDAGDMGALVTREQIVSVVVTIGLPAIQSYRGIEKPDPAAVDRTICRLADWLDRLGVYLAEIVPLSDGRTFLRLSHCPLDSSHVGSSAGIGISIGGTPLRMCQHTSCAMPFPKWRAAVEKQHGVKLQLGGSGRRLIFGKKNGAK